MALQYNFHFKKFSQWPQEVFLSPNLPMTIQGSEGTRNWSDVTGGSEGERYSQRQKGGCTEAKSINLPTYTFPLSLPSTLFSFLALKSVLELAYFLTLFPYLAEWCYFRMGLAGWFQQSGFSSAPRMRCSGGAKDLLLSLRPPALGYHQQGDSSSTHILLERPSRLGLGEARLVCLSFYLSMSPRLGLDSSTSISASKVLPPFYTWS